MNRFSLLLAAALAWSLAGCVPPTSPPSSASGADRVTTLAGTGVAGYQDGPGGQAQFKKPGGLALDSAGYLWVAEDGVHYGNNKVRQVAPEGTVSTPWAVSGSGVYTTGLVTVSPVSLGAVTKDDVLWPSTQAVYHSDKGTVGLFYGVYLNNKQPYATTVDQAGTIFTIVGGAFPRLMSNLSTYPNALTLNDAAVPSTDLTFAGIVGTDSGLVAAGTARVYVTSATAVYQIDTTTLAGAVTLVAGDPTTAGFADGQGTSARFDHPQGLARDAAGNLYVVDAANQRVRKVAPNGTVTTVAGSGVKSTLAQEPDSTPPEARFDFSDGSGGWAGQGVAVNPAGTVVYVVEYAKNRLRKVSL